MHFEGWLLRDLRQGRLEQQGLGWTMGGGWGVGARRGGEGAGITGVACSEVFTGVAFKAFGVTVGA